MHTTSSPDQPSRSPTMSQNDNNRKRRAKSPAGKRKRIKTPGEPKPSRKTAPKKHAPQITGTMRIAKAIARAGLCSRRQAEGWINDGRISVNGEVLASPALNVTPSDVIRVDGEPLPSHRQTQIFRYHKPKGQVTTHRDPDGRPTVFDALPKDLPRLISIGRLDLMTEGLLLLTNDGALARHLELPQTGWLRRYKVRAHGRITQKRLDQLKDGITIDGIRYGPIEARIERQQGSNIWLIIGIREGKNREVRRVLTELNLDVNRLIRLSFGPFQLGDLKSGTVEEINLKALREQLGAKKSEELGLQPLPQPKKSKSRTRAQ